MKKRVVKKHVNAWLKRRFKLVNGKFYSNVDGGFMVSKGSQHTPLFEFLAMKDIVATLGGYNTHRCCVGLSLVDGLFYGFSHRAVHGFRIGSETKKGDISYRPATIEDLAEDQLSFWSDSFHEWTTSKVGEDNKGRPCVIVTYRYNDKSPNKSLHGTTCKKEIYPKGRLGRGEWRAETFVDAMMMAMDFAEGVS